MDLAARCAGDREVVAPPLPPYDAALSLAARRFLMSRSRELRKQIGYDIHLLQMDPHRMGTEKLTARGDTYRFRSGSYRILYEIDQGRLLVLVIDIGDRKEVYRK
jgi:mRNA interferase RelE/StbE